MGICIFGCYCFLSFQNPERETQPDLSKAISQALSIAWLQARLPTSLHQFGNGNDWTDSLIPNSWFSSILVIAVMPLFTSSSASVLEGQPSSSFPHCCIYNTVYICQVANYEHPAYLTETSWYLIFLALCVASERQNTRSHIPSWGDLHMEPFLPLRKERVTRFSVAKRWT